MNTSEFRMAVCIGGPLDGAIRDHAMQDWIKAPVFAEPWAEAYKGHLTTSGIMRILSTDYRIERVKFQYGGLRVEGFAYLWEHNKNSPLQTLMAIVCSAITAPQGAAP